MRVSILYDTFQMYGVYHEESYTVRIKKGSPGMININFLFPNKTRGQPPNSFVTEVGLVLSTEEAIDVAAALNAFLHHPTSRHEEIEWDNEPENTDE